MCIYFFFSHKSNVNCKSCLKLRVYMLFILTTKIFIFIHTFNLKYYFFNCWIYYKDWLEILSNIFILFLVGYIKYINYYIVSLYTSLYTITLMYNYINNMICKNNINVLFLIFPKTFENLTLKKTVVVTMAVLNDLKIIKHLMIEILYYKL